MSTRSPRSSRDIADLILLGSGDNQAPTTTMTTNLVKGGLVPLFTPSRLDAETDDHDGYRHLSMMQPPGSACAAAGRIGTGHEAIDFPGSVSSARQRLLVRSMPALRGGTRPVARGRPIPDQDHHGPAAPL